MKKSKIESYAWAMVIAGGGCFVAYFIAMACSGYSMLGSLEDKDLEVTGQIGDFFGGVIGSIWTLAGVFLYFSALKLQNKQFVTQQEDMLQNKSLMSQQQFENIFFGLLRTQQELKSNLKGTFYSVEMNGYTYQKTCSEYETSLFFLHVIKEMRSLYEVYKREKYSSWEEEFVSEELRSYYEQREGEVDDPDFDYQEELRDMCHRFKLNYLTFRYVVKKETVEKAQHKQTEELMCKCVFGHVYIVYQEQLGHYFRHLYNIVKFLDKEKTACLTNIEGYAEEEKLRLEAEIERRFSGYFSFVHSMLSTSELCLLFYNSFLFPKAKGLYVKYNMFGNLLEDKLLSKEHAKLMKGATLKRNDEIFDEIIKELKNEVEPN